MRRRSPRSTRTDTLFPYTTLVRSFASVDIVFCALPHGLSQDLVRQLPAHLKVVDLGADFRLRDPQDYRKWYGLDHAAPELQPSVIYGLTEFYRDERSEEHTSELQSLMRIPYPVFCLKQKKRNTILHIPS